MTFLDLCCAPWASGLNYTRFGTIEATVAEELAQASPRGPPGTASQVALCHGEGGPGAASDRTNQSRVETQMTCARRLFSEAELAGTANGPEASEHLAPGEIV